MLRVLPHPYRSVVANSTRLGIKVEKEAPARMLLHRVVLTNKSNPSWSPLVLPWVVQIEIRQTVS
jgi:hypothetical protein